MDLMNNIIVKNDIEEILDSGIDLKQLYNRSILITGATGMIASYLILTFYQLNMLDDANIEIYALGRNERKIRDKFPGILNDAKFHFIEQDVTEPIEIEIKQMDYIIHAASNASPWYMINEPVEIIKANIIGTLNVLNFAKVHNTRHVHFLSTREIYGQQSESKEILTENDFGIMDALNIRAAYPESKKMAENLLMCYKDEYGIDFTVSRIAHSYGPGMNINNDGRIMADLINDVVNSRDIALKSDGSAVRAFIYVTDTVTGILEQLLNGQSGEAYNLSNETEEISIIDLSSLLLKLFPSRSKNVTHVNTNSASGYSKIKRIKLDNSKLSALGWKPKVDLQTGLIRTVKSFLTGD